MELSTVKRRASLKIDAAGIVLCIATSFGVYFAALHPFMQQRSFLAAQRQQLAVQTEESSKLKVSMLKLKDRLAAVQKELAQSKVKLESANQVNRRVAGITAFLNDCELQVDQVQIGKLCRGSSCELVPIGITGKGGYKHCAAFLHRLYRAFPDISLAKFELRGNPAKPGQLGTFRFELFWLTMPEAQKHDNLSTNMSVWSNSLPLGFM